ncbi:MAG: TonB family protein, partial [Bacteroidales bacterium]|nr:TonB family protein [Bacteroidales bacterium]
MKKTVFLIQFLTWISLTGMSDETLQADKSQSPCFFVMTDDPSVDRLPLKSVVADVSIAGFIADVIIVQQYKNEGRRPIEAVYIFPGSTRAAVYAMKMKIGERTITAKIEEREQAREDYEQAKNDGKNASLLEQQKPNVFQMNVANIMPGDVISVELCYTELLIPENGMYEFVYPTVVGPRYSSQEEKALAATNQWISNPYTHEGELPSYTFDLRVTLTSPVPLSEVSCRSHKVNIDYSSAKKAAISIPEQDKSGGNRDFILNYTLKGEKIESGIMLYEGKEENFFLATIQPPKVITPEIIPPREYVFIVDVSGSMYGFPLEVSKVLLKNLIGSLRPGDKFNVLQFAGSSGLMAEKSLDASAGNIKSALGFIDNLQGGGGTELLPALKKALSLKGTENYSRTFIIVTDGYVEVEKQTFDLIRENLGIANFFPFGIGSSVNRYIIEGMAHAGQGIPFVITDEAEAESTAEKFLKYVQSPVMTNIRVKYEGFSAYDVEPASIPDVLSDRPVVIFGKWKGNPGGRIILTGNSGTKEVSREIDIASARPDAANAALKYLWARERIRMLDDYSRVSYEETTGKEALGLGLKYNLLTQYTSFIAIDSEVRNLNGKPATVNQPLPLPEGVSDYAVGACQSYKKSSNSGTWSFTGKGSRPANVQRLEEVSIPGDAEPEEPVKEDPLVFAVAEQMPSFIGGVEKLKKFFDKNMIYPTDALNDGIDGDVLVEFLIGPDGSVTAISIFTSVFPSLDREAVRLIKLTDK